VATGVTGGTGMTARGWGGWGAGGGGGGSNRFKGKDNRLGMDGPQSTRSLFSIGLMAEGLGY
jgi:hypothetical protein